MLQWRDSNNIILFSVINMNYGATWLGNERLIWEVSNIKEEEMVWEEELEMCDAFKIP